MLKGTFCDSVLRMLSGYQYSKSEQGYQRRDIEIHINDGIGYVVDMDFNKNYTQGLPGNIDPGFLQTFEDIPVLLSSSRNQYYIDLPNLPIALPSGLGLFEVTPMTDQSAAYIPIQAGAAGLYKGLESENLFGEAGIRQEGRKGWFINGDFVGQESPKVMINMVCDTSTLSMDDELPIPSNYVGQVRQATFEFMAKSLGIPVDSSINSTPDARVK